MVIDATNKPKRRLQVDQTRAGAADEVRVGFKSILSPNAGNAALSLAAGEPSFFSDLNLDRIAADVFAGYDDPDLLRYFYTPLPDTDSITYRLAIVRDLDSTSVLTYVRAFADQMRIMRKQLDRSSKAYRRYQQLGWHLESVKTYCEGVKALSHQLSECPLASNALSNFRDYLSEYVGSPSFATLEADASALRSRLLNLQYSAIIFNNGVRVQEFNDDADYSVDVEKTFEKFREGAVKDYRIDSRPWRGGDVDGQIIELVGKLFPHEFAALEDFGQTHAQYFDDGIERFGREIQFYIAYADYIAPLRQAGIAFCYPQIDESGATTSIRGGVDLALANKLTDGKSLIVTNDFSLQPSERVIVVTGPNQGGKTTFARMFGQFHYLARLGLPVPAREAKLALCDFIYTHFERVEAVRDLRGKLHDDLLRARDLLAHAGPRSVLIMNEIFTSTSLEDALLLSRHVLKKIVEIGSLCVWVTFLDELASLGPETISMVAAVDPNDPTTRTFKLERRPPDGLSYAAAIATKYGISYDLVRQRVAK